MIFTSTEIILTDKLKSSFDEGCERSSTRISFAKNSKGALEVTDTNNYYPFGLNHISGMFSTSGFGSYYSYKYNGKELQETGMLDYGARMYMPDLGRWGVIDPLAETSRRFTPYHYGNNNPIRFTDPDGRLTVDNLQGGYTSGSAVADFFDRTGLTDKRNMPLFYRNESGMMVETKALGNEGQGGGGSITIGEVLESAGIELTGDISSYMEANAVLNLRDYLIKGGLENPEGTKASVGHARQLLQVELFKNLNAILNVVAKQKPNERVFFQETQRNDIIGKANGYKILLNIGKIPNVLQLAYVVGHEMNHSITDHFLSKFYDIVGTKGRNESNAFVYFSEYISYSWEEKLGSQKITNAKDYLYKVHGPEARNKDARYEQVSIDIVNNNMFNLLTGYNWFINNAKSKIGQ